MRMLIRRESSLALFDVFILPAFCCLCCLLPFGVTTRLFGQEQEKDAPAQDVQKNVQKTVPTLVEQRTELARLERTIREARARSMESRKAQVERLKELATEKRAIERNLEALRELVEKREAEVGQKTKDIAEKKEKLEGLKKRAEGIRKTLRQFLARVEEHVTNGIRWKMGLRNTSLEKVKSVLGQDTTPLGEGLAAVGRIQKEEESLARLVETGILELNVGEETTAVQAFHLGLLAVVFASEDGKLIGYAQPGRKPEDSLDAAQDADAVKGYLMAVDILRRRRTPAIVDLYLPSLPVSEDSGAKGEN